MRSMIPLLELLLGVAAVVGGGTNGRETEAKKLLEQYNSGAGKHLNAMALTYWDLKLKFEIFLDNYKFKNEMRQRALQFNSSTVSSDTWRQLSIIKNIGIIAQPSLDKVKELEKVKVRIQNIFNGARECDYSDFWDCIFANTDSIYNEDPSTYYDKASKMWVFWRKETSEGMKPFFTKYVQLSNEAVQFLGYHDLGEQRRSRYESDKLIEEVRALYDALLPLYRQLHAYVRTRLQDWFGLNRFPLTGHIPAHILATHTEENWVDIDKLVRPFENKTSFDVPSEMVRQNFTASRMFETAEDFITSLGLQQMVPTFWNRSRLTSSEGRCYPMAVDFFDGKDFRIQICTDNTHSSFKELHRLLGQVAYMMEYKDQPVVYREGANPAFMQAIGNVIALSYQTPEHLKKLNLIDDIPTDQETDINFLMSMALQTLAGLPYAYMLETWRWSVFNGSITEKNYNTEWWRLRCELEGVSPPVPRSESDFDPASDLYISFDEPYIRHFLGTILQFQFFKAACKAAHHDGPLHRCDISGSTEAGSKLRSMMKLGTSHHWRVALEKLTGSSEGDIGPLLEYFKPLSQFLEKENGNNTGWNARC